MPATPPIMCGGLGLGCIALVIFTTLDYKTFVTSTILDYKRPIICPNYVWGLGLGYIALVVFTTLDYKTFVTSLLHLTTKHLPLSLIMCGG